MPGSNNTEAEDEDDNVNPYAGSPEDVAEYIEKNNIPGPVWMEEIADADDLAAIQDALANIANQPTVEAPPQQGPPLPSDYTPPSVGAAPQLPSTGGTTNPYTPPPVVDPTVNPDVDSNVIPGSGSIYSGSVGAGFGTFIPISAIQGQLDDLRQDDLDAYNAIMGNVTPTGTVEINEDTLAAIEAMQGYADAPGQTIAEKPGEVEATPDTNPQLPADEQDVNSTVAQQLPDDWELDIKLILDALESGDEAAAAQAIANAQNTAATQKAVADASTTTQEAVTGAAGETQEVVTTTAGQTQDAVSGAAGETQDVVTTAAGQTQDAVSAAAGETQDVVTTTAGETQDAIATLQEAINAGALTFEELVASGFLDVTETFADTYEDLATQIETGQTDLATAIDNGLASVNTDIADQFGDVTTGLEGVAEGVTETQQAVEDTAGETQAAVGEAASETQDVVTTTAGDTQDTVTTTAGETQDVVTTSAGETQDVVNTAAGETQDVVTTSAGETQEAVQKAAETTDEAIKTLASAMGVTQDEIKEAVNNGNTQVIEGLAEIETLLTEADSAIEAVAEQVGLTGEELTKVIQDGDASVVQGLADIEAVLDQLPEPIAEALEPYFTALSEGITTLTSDQEKSLQSILETLGEMNVPVVSAIADSTADTIGAITGVKDVLLGMGEAVYDRLFKPREPGDAITADEYAADLAGAASIDRTGAGLGSGGSSVIGGTGSGGTGGGSGAGSRDPVNITDYISVDNDTQTGSGGGNVSTDPTSGEGAQSNAFTRPVPIANQELFGGYMGQAQRLSGTLDTYPQLQRQASEQYGAQVASEFPALNQDQQGAFAQYVTAKVQAKAGIGQDPGFLPYDIYNKVAPRLSEVLGDIGYYQYSSGRRIPGFMNYMPDYQDSMFNRQDIGTDPLPGGPPPTQPGFV